MAGAVKYLNVIVNECQRQAQGDDCQAGHENGNERVRARLADSSLSLADTLLSTDQTRPPVVCMW